MGGTIHLVYAYTVCMCSKIDHRSSGSAFGQAATKTGLIVRNKLGPTWLSIHNQRVVIHF